ncbi:MAG: hypothetical protein CSA34_02200 [Desulfobulbus propionicus]|nr:MAG: hypothetical protein CSA34_02200 [Desulfobulbus propionicus]
MIAICEECSKKYNVDETKIKSNRARFACFECGHMIIVVKPELITAIPDSKNGVAADTGE